MVNCAQHSWIVTTTLESGQEVIMLPALDVVPFGLNSHASCKTKYLRSDLLKPGTPRTPEVTHQQVERDCTHDSNHKHTSRTLTFRRQYGYPNNKSRQQHKTTFPLHEAPRRATPYHLRARTTRCDPHLGTWDTSDVVLRMLRAVVRSRCSCPTSNQQRSPSREQQGHDA